jgi:hypothetical protein
VPAPDPPANPPPPAVTPSSPLPEETPPPFPVAAPSPLPPASTSPAESPASSPEESPPPAPVDPPAPPNVPGPEPQKNASNRPFLLVHGAGVFESPQGIGLIAAGANVAANVIAVASSLPAVASGVNAANAGGNVVRSIGHTQFLAMSLSLQVPNIPADYIQLCAGMQWVNLHRGCTTCGDLYKAKSALIVALVGLACVFGLHCIARASIAIWCHVKHKSCAVPR